MVGSAADQNTDVFCKLDLDLLMKVFIVYEEKLSRYREK